MLCSVYLCTLGKVHSLLKLLIYILICVILGSFEMYVS